MVSFAISSMVLFNGRLPNLGFFLAQLFLDTQVRGKIGKNVTFAISSIARNTMVEMLYGAPQWEIPQSWFVSCSIVSIYSTTMTKLMFPFLAPQLQEKQWWRCSMWLLSQLMDSFLLNSFFISCSSMYTMLQAILRNLWWRCLIHKTILCENMLKKIMFTHYL